MSHSYHIVDGGELFDFLSSLSLATTSSQTSWSNQYQSGERADHPFESVDYYKMVHLFGVADGEGCNHRARPHLHIHNHHDLAGPLGIASLRASPCSTIHSNRAQAARLHEHLFPLLAP
jgi:hypothetical protein